MPPTDFLSFWGKAQPQPGTSAGWHPVAYHLLDVAAVAEALLVARPTTAARLARPLALPADEARRLVVALAGVHDLGKFAPAFQAKARDHWPASVLGPYRDECAVKRAHTVDGIVLWDRHLAGRLGARVWEGGAEPLRLLAPAVFGHHGRPVAVGGDPVRLRFRQGLAAAERCTEAVLALLLPSAIVAPPPEESGVRLASWLLSGVLTVADWVGSNERWFPYTAPDPADATLQGYWARAQEQAQVAIREAGLIPSTPSPERPFAEIARRPDAPTPVQMWASRVALPGPPTLFVVEDVTGAGKTEAAQMLVHRLMAAGRATGAYWAMPTMATANAMYARQGTAIGVLYAPRDDGARPSLVLAHGQQALHERFRRTVLRAEGEDPTARARRDDGGDEALESSVACAAFLADDRRAALLADIGAGTVDQALLGVLPSRFNTLRLFALADKVLVVDEAHAYDAYMGVEIQELLRFHAALGGSAVVLSATLSRRQRVALAQAWSDGLAGGGRGATFGGGVALASSEYP
ncbi:MAG TPA: CRISPR-associated endonuclease Cas3'', partial [Phytomonospora sp.]